MCIATLQASMHTDAAMKNNHHGKSKLHTNLIKITSPFSATDLKRVSLLFFSTGSESRKKRVFLLHFPLCHTFVCHTLCQKYVNWTLHLQIWEHVLTSLLLEPANCYANLRKTTNKVCHHSEHHQTKQPDKPCWRQDSPMSMIVHIKIIWGGWTKP